MMQPGFADPVLQAQACFRAVLDAMARPGQVHALGTGLQPPAPLDAATAAVLLTLADFETPLWLDQAAQDAAGWIAFHCGAPRVPQPAQYGFAVALALPPLEALPPGSHEAPEAAATLILQVRALGSGAAWRLAGPGLRAPATLLVDGLPHDFAAIWQQNHARFPRGIDLILCAGDQLAALPRSVTVTTG